MSKKIAFHTYFLLIGLAFMACKHRQVSQKNTALNAPVSNSPSKQEIEELIKKYPTQNLVLLSTDMGDMVVRLFNETPLHRDNFMKLAESHFYDSLLFHRVINEFMIQGGDPDSKKAKAGQHLGDGDIGYMVPAEFKPELFHKKGMLCAAREGDNINPSKASSGCQFYIVQGRKYTDESLKLVEYRINKEIRTKIKNDLLELPENQYLKDNEVRFKKDGKKDSLALTQKKIDELILPYYEKTPHYIFSQSQQDVYKTIGGTPHLDGSYTVYGEVVWGLSVIDKIAAAETDKNDRPISNILMKVKVLKKY